ncbi:PAS domain S-box protein [Paucidesulfovibrio longus]|uniref:PAS domain S-box protein n=1 Tax=Paucidesulfovibrio longus TaxID=889 RepID=UPI0003B3EC80|nr:PAS domain S-box protein [Paucidesulfovibrio longus]
MTKGQRIEELKEARQKLAATTAEAVAPEQGPPRFEESQDLFFSVFERHTAAMLLIEAESGMIVDANHAAATFYGYARDVFPTLHIEKINMLPKDELAQKHRNALELRENFFVFPHRTARGEQRWVEVLISPLVHQGRKLLLSIVHDATQRIKSEDALRERDAIKQAVLDSSNSFIMVKDLQGRFVFVNKAFARFIGVETDSLLGKTDFDILPKALAERFRSEDLSILETKRPLITEDMVPVGGQERYYLGIRTPLLDAEGNGSGVCVVTTDITDRKRTEEELRKSEARLQEAQHLAKVGCWEFDMRTNEIWGSEQGFRIYGMTPPPSNLLSIEEIEACIPEKKRVNQALMDLINEDKPYDLEFDIFPADGSPRKTIVSKAKVERDESGNPLRVTGVILDITERQKAEKALKRIEWLLTRKPKQEIAPAYVPPYGDVTELNTCGVIMESVGQETLHDIASQSIELLETSVAVYERNGDYAFGMFTSGWCQFMDAASRKLCGDVDNRRALDCGKWLCHDDCWSNSAKAAMETGQATDISCVGGLHLYGVPIFAGEEVVGAINIGYGNPPTDDETLERLAADFQVDVAELRRQASQYEARPAFIVDQTKANLKRAARLIGEMVSRSRLEKKLVTAQAAAEAANRAKSEFLANMSHEIRTPLNGVMGMLQLLEGCGLEAEAAQYADLALRSSRNLLTIINDILDFSKIEAGKITIEEELFEIDSLFKSVIDTFALQSAQKGLDVSYGIAPETPKTIFGDVARIRQVLFNLVGNAVKFTEHGSVCTNVRVLERIAPDRLRLGVTVSDTGIGIEPDQLDSLFTPFTQAAGFNKQKFKGTGLGLSIVKRLINLMDGSVRLESTPGQGTRVSFDISVGIPKEKNASLVRRCREADPHFAAAPLRILVAEDESLNARVLEGMLKKQGHSLLFAVDGREALDLLTSNKVDLILMDIQMPVMDGVEATRRIRAGEAGADTAGTPIIALTAHAMPGDKEKFLSAGMNGYLAKPVDMRELHDALSKARPSSDRPS